MSSFRTRRTRTSSRPSLALAGSALALAAFASGIAGVALAGPASTQAQARLTAAAASAGPAGNARAGQSPGSGPAAHRGAVVLAARSGPSHPVARRNARRMMHYRFHWSVRKQYRYLSRLWDRESGWNTHAYNPYSGAYGIPQADPGSKMSSAGPHWRSCAKTQMRWGMRYIKGRYGTPRHAWQHEIDDGWY